MRVTSQTMSLTVSEALQRTLGRVQTAQAQLASGRRINRYSDAPADAAAALRLRAREADWDVFHRAAEDAAGWLATQDTALQSAASILQRVRELAVGAANSTLSAAGRESTAAELEQLRDQLVGLANTTYLGQQVFAGFASLAVEQAGGVWSFVGDGGGVTRRIEPDVVLTVNLDGAEIFGFSADADVFAVIDRLAADVRAGDVAGVGGADLDAVDARMQDVFNGLARVGADARRVEAAQAAFLDQAEALATQRSAIEDVDLAEAVMEMQVAENGYQSALAAVARLSLPSLAQFLA